MTRRLSELRPGQSGTLVSIESRSVSRLDRLSMMGMTPGFEVTLEQRRPAYVVRVGFTELSIEREVADEIMIETN
jgi:DtxR family Mn-dependent transcriptional regulator